MNLTEDHIPALVSDDEQRKIVPLDADPFVIGRLKECNLQLLDAKVSRTHAEIRSCQSGCEIVDRNSVHGTSVNGDRIAAALLKHGDRLTFGEKFGYVYFDRCDPDLFERVGCRSAQDDGSGSGEVLMGLVSDYETRPNRECNVSFSFRCALDWVSLAPTGVAGIRYCATCSKDVHYCNSLDEIQRAINDRRCVAFPAELAKEYRKN